ncbi:MAG: hypothetical protein WBW48_09745 [Anaerolineae bacterium]
MEQQTQKKVWVTPELIVLVRSKPEEAVMMACKWLPSAVGANNGQDACCLVPECNWCSDLSIS